MMKRVWIALLALSLLLLSGCGSQPAGSGGTSTTGAGTAGTTQPNSEPGFVFKSGDVTITMGAKAEPILAALGEPEEVFEAPSCAFNGLDKTFFYKSFEVYTFPKDDQDYILSVRIKDDSIATPEGVTIGDSFDKMTATYGTDYKNELKLYTYTKGNTTLTFQIADDNTIAGIDYKYIV